MKTFKFKSIWLLSDSEQTARSESFSPKKTLLVGMNHTGKSSLIKSLFTALGAFPAGQLDRWNKDTTVLVEFSVDGVDYYVVQQRNNRGLFDAQGRLNFTSANATDWGRNFAELVGFNLILTDRKLKSVTGDARTFFLPFYINQDGSWLSDWSTFDNLQQYQKPIGPVLEYFTGVKPPEYYDLNSQKLVHQKDLSELRGEEKVIKTIKDRFGRTVPLDGPKTMPEVFEQDIARLTIEINEINSEQEEIRNNIVRERETAESLELQIKMAHQALSQYDSDSSFLQTEPHNVLVCPVCHAEHGKTFMDLLRYSEDARVLRNLAVELKNDHLKISRTLEGSKDRLRSLDDNYRKISNILETRRGDLKLNDVVRAMGAESAFAAFEAELSELEVKINPLVTAIDKLNRRLSELTNRKRSNSILSDFRKYYDIALKSLNMPSVETGKMNLNRRPKISGSGGPRSILAYYAALWHTSLGEYGSFSIPAVIDSPQQQGQDATNLPIMIEYIATKLPSDMQIILAVEEPTKFKFEKVIELNEPYNLLSPDQYDQIRKFIDPFTDAMYRALLG
ncbi:AAA family ATPase [Stappia indica]|uniref:AAA family ATPase n=1 Tax=Stappia indica TaxID=538381 RepID=UPI000A56E95E|nr:AAA family ATPase [Stappia indica]